MKSIADWHAVLTRSDPSCRSVDEAERLAQPESFDHLHLLAESYDQVRRYAPVLLETFDFRAAPAVAHLMAAINTLRVMTPAKLADEIFAVGSPLRTLPAKEVIVADCKDYKEGDFRFNVSQIEELGFSSFSSKQEDLFRALEEYRASQSAYFSALLVTDVNTHNSLLLVAAPPEFLNTIQYPNLAPNLYELHGVVSRKKQLLPYLLDCL